MGRQSKITKEMGIYEVAAYQQATSGHGDAIPTTMMDPTRMRELIAEAARTPAKALPIVAARARAFWIPLAIALTPALVYLAIHHMHAH